MKYLLLTPPLTQLNTPYPATTVLKAYLEEQGHETTQADLGIELILKIYTPEFLEKIFSQTQSATPTTQRIALMKRDYIKCVEPIIRFLQGKDNTLATHIANGTLLPEGPRFDNLADMEWAFGTSGTDDKARYMATLFIEDIADYIRENISPYFDLIRYAEHLAQYAPEFDQMEEALNKPTNITDKLLLDILEKHIAEQQPDIIGLTVPFPGCLYAALLCGKYIKTHHPNIKVVIGGGFANTEWRTLSEKRIFKYTD